MSNLLSNVNELFQNHSIEELQKMVFKIRTDVEMKKDDLRLLVGERHRDIIDASDRILEMNNLTFKIWNFMDSGKHTVSAKLFFISRNINARLQLSRETESSDIDASVLVNRAWNSLIHLETAVISACQRRVNALSSTLLLMKDYNLEKILKDYLQGRKIALCQLLGLGSFSSDDISSTKIHTISIRKLLVLVGRLLLSSWDTFDYLFNSNKAHTDALSGAFYGELAILKDWKFRDEKFLTNDCLYDYLPESVLNFTLIDAKFNLQTHFEDYNASPDLVQYWNDCFNDVLHQSRLSLSESLTHVATFESVIDLRNTILAVVNTKWKMAYNAMKEFDIWEKLYHDLFLDRIKIVFNETLDGALNEWTNQIGQLIKNVVSLPEKSDASVSSHSSAGQLNLSTFVWSDCKEEEEIQQVNANLFSLFASRDQSDDTLANQHCPSPMHDYWNTKSINRLAHSHDVGLVVFYRLMNMPIPKSILHNLNSRSGESEQFHAPTQLLVFFQRMLNDNSTICNRTDVGLSNVNRKLKLLLPQLQLLGEKLNSHIVNAIITLVSDCGSDAYELWDLIRSSMRRLINRVETWIHQKAYGIDCCQSPKSLQITPSDALLLSRTCWSLIYFCPSLNAASIVAAGVGEFRNMLNESKLNSDVGSSVKDRFLWSKMSMLRDICDENNRPVCDLAHQLMFDSLIRATTECLLVDKFESQMKSAFFINLLPNGSVTEFNMASIHTLLMQFTNFDNLSQAIVPFKKIHFDSVEKIQTDDGGDSNNNNNDDDDGGGNGSVLICLPFQVSLPLHDFLLNIVHQMEILIVHMFLEPPFNYRFFAQLCQQLVDVYAQLIDHLVATQQKFVRNTDASAESKDNNHLTESCLWIYTSVQKLLQDRAFQLMFDLKFLQKICVSPKISGLDLKPNDNNVQHKAAFHHLDAAIGQLVLRLQSLVDPFDLNMCAMHLNQAVSVLLHSTFHLYAPIFDFNAALQTENLRNTKVGSKKDDVQLSTAVAKQNPSFFELNSVASKPKPNDVFNSPIPLNLSDVRH